MFFDINKLIITILSLGFIIRLLSVSFKIVMYENIWVNTYIYTNVHGVDALFYLRNIEIP